MRAPNPSAPRFPGFAQSKPSSGCQCRGEDSNLCCVAERFLHVGLPLLGKPMQRLYFIQEPPDGPVKIGVSADPVERLRIMQVGNPRQLSLISWMDVPRGVEAGLHDYFHSDRVSGEWLSRRRCFCTLQSMRGCTPRAR